VTAVTVSVHHCTPASTVSVCNRPCSVPTPFFSCPNESRQGATGESSQWRTTTKADQHSAEEIIRILAQADQGTQTVGELCRDFGIAETTFSRWRNPYDGMPVAEVRRLKDLEPSGQRRTLVSSASSPSGYSKSMYSKALLEKRVVTPSVTPAA
jgi:putative transposase